MSTIFDTIEMIRRSLQDDLDDPHQVYKIRTVRQLVAGVRDRSEAFEQALTEADLDEDTIQNLEDLGYL